VAGRLCGCQRCAAFAVYHFGVGLHPQQQLDHLPLPRRRREVQRRAPGVVRVREQRAARLLQQHLQQPGVTRASALGEGCGACRISPPRVRLGAQEPDGQLLTHRALAEQQAER